MAMHPTDGSGRTAAPSRDYGADAAAAAGLRREIEAKMEQAAPPQEILYDAFSLIGYLLHDETWTDEQKGKLSALFDGLERPGLFPAADAEKLEAAQAAYKEKTIRQLKRNLAENSRLADALRDALRKAEGLTDETPPAEEERAGEYLDVPL